MRWVGVQGVVLMQEGCLEETTVARSRPGVRLEMPPPLSASLSPLPPAIVPPLQVKVTSLGALLSRSRSLPAVSPTARCRHHLHPTTRHWGGEANNINPSQSLSPGACLRSLGEEAQAAINHRPLPWAACPSSQCFTALTPARI